ncbi:MAG: amino-acid N-acetyltransferase [Betaproteobacteria bacterium]|nr:amino-acid N-acetyltransferase [Betaproteobacteria bacterium]
MQKKPTPGSNAPQFVAWFRSVAPYFHAFRGKTFVVAFGGELVDRARFFEFAHDLNLLHSAGIRVVLVHGSRPQIEAQLKQRKARSRYHNGLRITDPVALECVKEAVGLLRVEIDAVLSQGLPNSPMGGAAINTASGNFITAQPLGVHNGIDYQYTGSVRKIDVAAVRGCLDAGNIVIVSPIGNSPTGEVFNLAMEDVAVATAKALVADKLIFLSDAPVQDNNGKPVPELSADRADVLLASGEHLTDDTRLYLAHAVEAVRAGVRRAHLVSHKVDGSILIELFTHDGSGSIITSGELEQLRTATIDDVGGILQLIEPLEEDGTLVRRGRERLEREISRFFVLEHDGVILGCAALYPFPKDRAGELACLAVRPEARGNGYGDKLADAICDNARKMGMKRIFVLTTRAMHWFVEREFREVTIDKLPAERKALYNLQRRSHVLMRSV